MTNSDAPSQTAGPDSADELATQRAIAALDNMAAAWARGANVTRAVSLMLARDDREGCIEAYIKMAWVEGAWAARHSLSIQEIEELGSGGR